jgi:hypothetical protein
MGGKSQKAAQPGAGRLVKGLEINDAGLAILV